VSEVTITRTDVVIPGAPAPGLYVAPPSPRAAVVVVHEIFGGRQPELVAVCERFAAAGYAALMPDLFGDGLTPVCIARSLREIARGDGPSVQALRAAGDVVARESGVPRERVGVIGFCLGGGFALVVGKAFAATAANYGELVDIDVLRGIGPTIACFGSRDRAYRDKAPVLRERLQQLAVPHEVKVYDAGHAFLTEGHHPVAATLTRLLLDVDPARDAAARNEGWRDLMAFFARHLLDDVSGPSSSSSLPSSSPSSSLP
jgi:carboxymethylenebutenolidase